MVFLICLFVGSCTVSLRGGYFKGKKKGKTKGREHSFILLSSLARPVSGYSCALYPATRAPFIRLLALSVSSYSLYLATRALFISSGRHLSNRAPQSSLFAIAKQMCVNILLKNYKYKNSKALRILNKMKTRRIRHVFFLSSAYRQN